MSTWGCSIDGCTDAIAKPAIGSDNFEILRGSFAPSCVILPKNSFEQSIVGERAKDSRICRGYDWPPESRFNPVNGVERLPVSLAWQLLVAAGDSRISWRGSKSAHIPLAKPIADHVVNYLPEGVNQIVLAIPNDLHEYGQYALISALKRKGCQATLLWRPIAAAIAWCNRLPPKEVKARIEKDDNLIIIHLGADGFEFVPLRLRKDERNGIEYVVPLRTRPKPTPSVSGSLILASAAEILIQRLYGEYDTSAFWQAFIIFHDLWTTALGHKGYNGQFPEFIQVNNTWDFWKPHDHIESSLQNADIRSQWLEDVIKECCNFDLSAVMPGEIDPSEYVRQGISDAINQCDGKIVGAIITGNMEHLPCGQGLTLKDIVFEELKKANLEYENLSHPAGTYYPDDTQIDLTAEGCLIYHKRIENELPTYYDTLPKLDIRAIVDRKPQWCSLVKSEVVEGGKKYEDIIERKFAVKPGQMDLDFFLRREDADEYRKLPFNLPAPAPSQIGLDLKVTMQPAQGFASVEVVPGKAKAFGTEQLYLDWSQMTPSPLTKEPSGIGYPKTFGIDIHPDVYWRVFPVFREYGETDINSHNYLEVIKRLRDEIKLQRQIFDGTRFRKYRLVDENGNLPEEIDKDSNILKKIIDKIDDEFKKIPSLKKSSNNKKAQKILLQTATWLFAAAPENCINYIRDVFMKSDIFSFPPPYIVFAAGRSFTKEQDIKLFFDIAVERIRFDEQRTNVWINSLCRILQHREYAPKCLERKQALFLAQFASRRMKSQLYKRNIKQIFKNSAHLFLYLLRWRIVGNFLDEGDEYELGQQVKEILEEASEISGNKHIQDILKEIAKYIEYQGEKYITGFPEDDSDNSA